MNRALVLVLALTGCKRPDDVGQILEQMDHFATAMCACKDKDCAYTVNNDLTAWSMQMAKQSTAEERPSPELAKQAAVFMENYTQCMVKLIATDPKADANR